MTHMWKLEGNFVELILSFVLYMGSGDQTQVTYVQQVPYTLSWLAGPVTSILYNFYFYYCGFLQFL